MNLALSTRHLPEIAESIKAKYAEGRRLNMSQGDLYLAIGHDLADARAQFGENDKEFGRWFATQEFGFTTQWAGLLRRGAEHEPEVRGVLESQLSSTGSVNFEKAVKTVIRPQLPSGAVDAAPDQELDSDLFAVLSNVIDALVALRAYDPEQLAASVPESKRDSAAKALDKATHYIGRVTYSIRKR